MVKYSVIENKYNRSRSEKLDMAFAAIADPTRRAIVAELSRHQRRPQSISQLARPFSMSLPAVMKHVRVLEQGGLIYRDKIGRTVYCRLNYKTLHAAGKWFEDYEKFWNAQLDKLGRYLAE